MINQSIYNRSPIKRFWQFMSIHLPLIQNFSFGHFPNSFILSISTCFIPRRISVRQFKNGRGMSDSTEKLSSVRLFSWINARCARTIWPVSPVFKTRYTVSTWSSGHLFQNIKNLWGSELFTEEATEIQNYPWLIAKSIRISNPSFALLEVSGIEQPKIAFDNIQAGEREFDQMNKADFQQQRRRSNGSR